MLLYQHCRGSQESGLLAAQDGLENGPQRHFGLAVANVAAHQPIHGPFALHVGHDLVDSALLIWGFLERKRRLELAKHTVGRRKRMPRQGRPLSVDLQKLLGQGLDLLGHLAPGLFPGNPTELVQTRLVALGSYVARDLVEPINRQIELATAILEMEKIDLRATLAYGQLAQAAVQAHAVKVVDHVVADSELREVCGSAGERGSGPLGRGSLPSRAAPPRAKDIVG